MPKLSTEQRTKIDELKQKVRDTHHEIDDDWARDLLTEAEWDVDKSTTQ